MRQMPTKASNAVLRNIQILHLQNIYIKDKDNRPEQIHKQGSILVNVVGCILHACQPYMFRWPSLDISAGRGGGGGP